MGLDRRGTCASLIALLSKATDGYQVESSPARVLAVVTKGRPIILNLVSVIRLIMSDAILCSVQSLIYTLPDRHRRHRSVEGPNLGRCPHPGWV